MFTLEGFTSLCGKNCLLLPHCPLQQEIPTENWLELSKMQAKTNLHQYHLENFIWRFLNKPQKDTEKDTSAWLCLKCIPMTSAVFHPQPQCMCQEPIQGHPKCFDTEFHLWNSVLRGNFIHTINPNMEKLLYIKMPFTE